MKMTTLTRWLPLLLILVMAAYNAVRFDSLPAELPVQVQLDGSIRMMPREQAIWVMPVITGVIWLIMGVTPYIDPRRDLYRRYKKFYMLNQNALILFLFAVHMVMLTHFDEPVMIARLVIIGALILFIVIGNEMPRVPAAMIMNIRPRWLLGMGKASRRTSRFAGHALVLVGISVLPAAVMLPLNTVMLVLTIMLMLSMIGIVWYSYTDMQQAEA